MKTSSEIKEMSAKELIQYISDTSTAYGATIRLMCRVWLTANPPVASTQLKEHPERLVENWAKHHPEAQFGGDGPWNNGGEGWEPEPQNTPEKPVSVYVQKEPFCDTYKGDEDQSLADSLREATQEELEQARKASEESGDPVFWLLYEMGLFAPIRP